MFRSARWRGEKNKIKVVFKLQFHATQVSRLVGDALVISLVPADSGKPTARLDKATIQDGCCHWENPIYETVQFIKEAKTGKIHERIYHFVLSNGSPKAGLVGEVSIDFSNYAEATKISSVSLPLKSAKYEAMLHVSIQRMLDSVDQREIDENDHAKLASLDRSLRAQFSNGNIDGSIKNNSTEDESINKAVSSVSLLNVNLRSSSGSDLTISDSDSSSELDTHQEIEPNENASPPQKLPTEEHHQWEWTGGSAPEESTDDSSSSPRGTLLRDGSEPVSDIMIENLKSEISALSRQVEVSELELQSLRKQIVRENKRGLDLSREIVSLKIERDSFKEEWENLKATRKNKMLLDGADPMALVEELRQELNYEKDLNSNLRLQLQKTQESNAELILAVRDLDEMLEQKSKEKRLENEEDGDYDDDDDDDEEQKALEKLVKEHSDVKEAYVLEQKIMDLCSEIEIYRRDKDELEMQMEQLALDYEILKQENHEISYKLEQSQVQEQLKMQYECSSSYATVNELESQIESLENDLKKQSGELSESFVTISELEAHVNRLEEEMDKQAQGFEADLEAVMAAKVEQEQRAIRAEETLKNARLKNAKTAERLQEEFKKLSMQVASTFDVNEKLAAKALTEANELRLEKIHMEEMLQKVKKELDLVRDHYEAKLGELSSELELKKNHLEQMKSEIKEKSTQLEEQKQKGENACGVLSHEILMVRAESERLKTENIALVEEAEEKEILRVELEQLRTSVKQMELLVEEGNTEKNELEGVISSLKKKTEESLTELSIMRCLKDEMQSVIGNLQLEVETIRAQCNELKQSLLEDELEKEKLRKLVFQLKSDLKQKEDAFSSVEKKLKDCKGRATALDGAKASSRNNKSAPVDRGSKEVSNMKEKIKVLECQIKLKEAALNNSTNLFLEKEKDLYNKIEELERRLETLDQNSAKLCDNGIDEVARDTEDLISNVGMIEEGRNTRENLCTSGETRCPMPSIKRHDENIPGELKTSTISTRNNGDLEELLREMSLLKEKNNTMETELKEMQGRYSEISLKFAEVEGERQQLVMTLRNLKNPKKS